MLETHNLTKVFGRAVGAQESILALDDVDFHVAEGELMTVLGPSGCGKTTLLRVIAGFETPDSGTVTVAGRPIVAEGARTVPAHARGIGLVPQEGALFPHLSVAQNVGFGLRRLHPCERRDRVAETLELVGLAGFGRRRPHELSGGQQQRVALARAIAPRPQVVLLDEPFSALDEYLRENLRSEVRALLTRLGTTTIMVTHDQEEALAMGDRVAVMRAGRVIQVGPPRETYFQPADLQLARFLGEAVVIKGELVGAGTDRACVSCAFGTLPVAMANGCTGPCDVLIRPENIRIGDVADTRSPGLVGTVREQTFYGHDGLLRVHVAQLGGDVTVRVLGDHPHRVGDDVRLTVERSVSTYPIERAAA
ncbi:ABC transporter ATP-binding protein [Microbacterium kribbense]|uniref:ABC transporter ATP-binding protein n=1 Tax=Microbacterium kribbense TaxID=433645 RepID=A0ABP7GK19_9MICO